MNTLQGRPKAERKRRLREARMPKRWARTRKCRCTGRRVSRQERHTRTQRQGHDPSKGSTCRSAVARARPT